jgi:hypothetical protein
VHCPLGTSSFFRASRYCVTATPRFPRLAVRHTDVDTFRRISYQVKLVRRQKRSLSRLSLRKCRRSPCARKDISDLRIQIKEPEENERSCPAIRTGSSRPGRLIVWVCISNSHVAQKHSIPDPAVYTAHPSTRSDQPELGTHRSSSCPSTQSSLQPFRHFN